MNAELAVQGAKLTGLFTLFMDMHSGGGRKLGAEFIYVQATEDEAEEIFEGIFNRDPNNVTCSCCGSDYSVYEETDPEVTNGAFVVMAEDIQRHKEASA